MNRRKFIQLGVVGTGAIVAGVEPLSADPAPAAKPATTVAMPISIAPLARQDLDTLFADMRERAGVNALFPFMYTHEPHRAGVSSVNFHGGNYARPHMQFYKDTPLTFDDMHAPEFGGVDVLQRVIPVAQSFSPFQRAEENLADLAPCSDFIRPALYNNAAGGRFVRFVNGARAGVWGDCASAEVCKVLFDELGYPAPPPNTSIKQYNIINPFPCGSDRSTRGVKKSVFIPVIVDVVYVKTILRF
ncbi:MAG TPA: hypothetical protein VMH30_04715 [Verrucomicrobiae bacterium]|nr:hypothetical protein [Verrucomicrobiae bacterium]